MNSKKTIYIRWMIVVAGILLATIVFIYFYLFSPINNTGIFPACSIKKATGYECVGCGGQRAVHELLHFRIISAFKYNQFFVLSIPLLVYYIFHFIKRFIYNTPEPNIFFYTWRFGRIFILSLLIFIILRNVL